MSTSVGCKDGASKSNDNVVCEVNEKLQNMSTADMSTDDVSVCANCGKEGNSNEISNMCNKCKQVKYCNAACKKKHRHKHRKECEEYLKRAAKHEAELHDEKLFKQPPPEEDCPICMLRLPCLGTGSVYMACCGKIICRGCIYAFQSRITKDEHDVCPFCRTPPPPTNDEIVKRYKQRMQMNDARATYNIGCFYANGKFDLPQNRAKALELWHQAGELGCAVANSCIGNVYTFSKGVKRNENKANRHYELAAMGGDVEARCNLGVYEIKKGNLDRGLKHYMIAVKDGSSTSLENIKMLYLNGYVMKDDYTEALRSYQAYLDEVKSDQRDEAAAADAYI